MGKTAAIILNYNDADMTIRLLDRIRNYSCPEDILVVDNHSTDDSCLRLGAFAEKYPNMTFLETEKNGGYGWGNNFGIRYAQEKLHAKYALIANPDTVFSERCIRKMTDMMERHPDLGIISPVMNTTDRSEEIQIPGTRANVLSGASAWPMRPWLYDLLESGPLSRRLFRRIMHYDEKFYQNRKCVRVGAVSGSLLLVDIDKMVSAGGYDENVFLYEEEYILGYRMREKGYAAALLLTEDYLHLHRNNPAEPAVSLLKKEKQRHESMLYYFERYLGISRWKAVITKCFFAIVDMEIVLFYRGKKALPLKKDNE